MANKFPLIVNSSAGQIQQIQGTDDLELPGQLKLTGTSSITAGDIVSTGGNDANFGIFCSTSVSNSSKITVVGRNNANNGNVTIADFIVGGSNTPELKCFGDITAFASSDATLKENITPISNAVDKVLSISGNTFTWNEKSIYNGE